MTQFASAFKCINNDKHTMFYLCGMVIKITSLKINRWCVTTVRGFEDTRFTWPSFSKRWHLPENWNHWKNNGMLDQRNWFVLWQIGPNLSSGIRWCLALASVRPQWCLLWRFWCVCMCVCRVNGGPDLVCVMKACLIRVICVNCGIRNLGIYQMLRISGTCNVCSSCVLWLDLSPGWVMSVSKWGC